DQHDRVGVGLVGGVVELDRVVVLGVGLAGRGGVHDGGRGLGAVGDELVPDADRGGAQLAGVRGVHVADGALAALDGGDHTGGALGGLDRLDRPVAADLVRPGVARGLGEVGDEVLGGARLVGAVHRDDVGGGEVDVRVGLLDRLVVPGGDLLVEDVRDDLGGEVEGVDALQVEGDRDGRDV